MAIGLGYWFTRHRMLGYERWIAHKIVRNPSLKYTHGKVRFWWDLIVTAIWCGATTWSFVNGLFS